MNALLARPSARHQITESPPPIFLGRSKSPVQKHHLDDREIKDLFSDRDERPRFSAYSRENQIQYFSTMSPKLQSPVHDPRYK